MERREFLKISGVMAVGAAAASLTGCAGKVVGAHPVSALGKVASHQDGIGLLGYGCMRWPMIKDSEGRDIVDQKKVDEMVELALEHGVNYFDSAPVYLQGQSEAATGLALSRYPRESYLVATKLSNFADDSYEAGVAMYRSSLENFRTDHIDYYLLHSLSGYDVFKKRFEDNGLIDFLLKEREAGNIRHLGFSFHGPRSGFDEMLALHEKYHWDFVQIQMNYSDWYNEDGEPSAYMYHRLDRMEIPVVIMEPLLGGRLANIPAPLLEMLKMREPQKSAASWAFRFCGSFPRVMTVLSGMTYKEHLEDNLRTFCDFTPLEGIQLDLLDNIAKGLRDYHLVECTGCQYCMPCPYGLDIPAIFKFYNSHITDGTYVVSSGQKKYEQLRRRYLTDYDKSVESARQADHCIGCGACLKKCPQHIKIPNELRRINSYIEDVKQGNI